MPKTDSVKTSKISSGANSRKPDNKEAIVNVNGKTRRIDIPLEKVSAKRITKAIT